MYNFIYNNMAIYIYIYIGTCRAVYRATNVLIKQLSGWYIYRDRSTFNLLILVPIFVDGVRHVHIYECIIYIKFIHI